MNLSCGITVGSSTEVPGRILLLQETLIIIIIIIIIIKVKVIPQKAEVAQGVPGRLRSRIFLTFGTTRVVGRQLYTPAAFTPEEIPGTHFQVLSRPQDTGFRRGEPRKKSQMTPPGIDPGTVRVVAHCLNHYATPGPNNNNNNNNNNNGSRHNLDTS